jgi:hypothetical protein
MKAPNSQRSLATDLELEDLTQEIDAPLVDQFLQPDEPTLSKLDFEDLEIAFDF